MKILFVTLSNLGDVILTLPVYQTLCRTYPDARIDVIGSVSGQAVFDGDERVARYTVYDRRMGWSAKWRFLMAIRAERYDLIIDLRRSLIGHFGGSIRRNALLGSGSRDRHRALVHADSLKGVAPALSSESYLNRFRGRGPDLSGRKIVVASPGSKSDVKEWPAASFAEVLDRLAAEEECEIILVGDAADKADVEAVRKQMRSTVIDLCGKTDLAALSDVLRQASLLITNDSAPLHIADSLKTPVLALFGPTDPEKYGPRYFRSRALSKGLFCQPCEKAQCRYGRECLNELSPAEVFTHAVRILRDERTGGHFKVLAIRLDRLGDAVLSLPAVEALRERFPDAHLSVLTRPYTRQVFEGHPAVDETIVYDYSRTGRQRPLLGYWRMIREIRRKDFDVCVVLHPGIRSYLIPFLAGIPHRIGYRTKHRFLLTRSVPDLRHLGRKHEARYTFDLLSPLGIGPSRFSQPKINVDSRAARSVAEKLHRAGMDLEHGWIAVHPGASCPSKRWGLGQFRTLVERLLHDFGVPVVVIGGEDEKKDGQALRLGLETHVFNLAGAFSVAELAAFFSGTKVLVSNDSGPVHVAAAVGCRVVSLFGRNQAGLSAARWKPLGQGHVVIQKDVGCLVCLAHRCPIEFECLKAIRVEDVLAALRPMIASRSLPARR